MEKRKVGKPPKITTSRETVIASLRKCAGGGDSCAGCAYITGRYTCRMRDLMNDAVTLLERES